MTLELLGINRCDEQNQLLFDLSQLLILYFKALIIYVTVILYFWHSFSFSPCRRFVFQTKISGKYIVLVLISLLFYFFSSLCGGDQSTIFSTVSSNQNSVILNSAILNSKFPLELPFSHLLLALFNSCYFKPFFVSPEGLK